MCVCRCVLCVCVHLLEVLAQCDPQASFLMSEHLAGHQAVENSREGQRNAEVEAKQPPVLRIPVELQGRDTGSFRLRSRTFENTLSGPPAFERNLKGFLRLISELISNISELSRALQSFSRDLKTYLEHLVTTSLKSSQTSLVLWNTSETL